jgi:hypothetical protein
MALECQPRQRSHLLWVCDRLLLPGRTGCILANRTHIWDSPGGRAYWTVGLSAAASTCQVSPARTGSAFSGVPTTCRVRCFRLCALEPLRSPTRLKLRVTLSLQGLSLVPSQTCGAQKVTVCNGPRARVCSRRSHATSTRPSSLQPQEPSHRAFPPAKIRTTCHRDT